MELKVYSEIGKLKKVLLHRPGEELENLTPDMLERLLFDDIPWLELAQKEHDEFSGLLRSKGVKVYYIENLVAEAIENEKVKKEFITKFSKEAIGANDNILNPKIAKEELENYLYNIKDNLELVNISIAGIRKEVLSKKIIIKNNYLFITDPIPNLYFQRDPFSTIGNGISLNTMYSVTRNRETLYAYIMFKYHPEFKGSKTPFFYERNQEFSIEGGDQLVLNEKTLLIGRSQRTRFEAIEKLAQNILFSENTKFEKIVAFEIGKSRKYMHLDTVFTQVDKNKFSVHPDVINENMNVWYITKENGKIKKEKKSGHTLREILQELTGIKDIKFIECGGTDPISSAREQWNDGANTLALSPGEVVVYSRNPVTNKLLEENGIKINVISSAELSRGRGGPRCMSMPLEREEI